MNADDLRRLTAAGSAATVPAGSLLIERGQYGGGLFLILEGTAVVETPDGGIEFGAGSVLGERALLSPTGTRAARVRAKTNLSVIAVDRLAFEQLCLDDDGFARRLAAATGD